VTKRPPISEKTKIAIAISQAQSGVIFCPICHTGISPDDERILEHMVPHEFGGPSTVDNLAWVHKGCAYVKTNGTKATCADGDIHKIAKAKRIASGGRKVRHPMRKHPTLKRTVGGKVVERTDD
jgi:hypothetical protein